MRMQAAAEEEAAADAHTASSPGKRKQMDGDAKVCGRPMCASNNIEHHMMKIMCNMHVHMPPAVRHLPRCSCPSCGVLCA